MRTIRLPLALSCLVLGMAGRTVAETPAPAPGGVIDSSFTKVRATVVRVDLKTREAELRDENGKVFTISVGEAVKNLDQVRPGDVVLATLTESKAYSVKKTGQAKPGTRVASSGDTGEAGEKPKGKTRKVTTTTVTITAIDEKAHSLTFTRANGEKKTVLLDPSQLAGMKVGDLVEITNTEAVAFSVEKAPGK